MPTPDIFLSYSREDQATARRFADALQAEGFIVWWDQTLRTGEAYDHVTEQALRGARAVVVLWSRTSVVSRWVRAEATIADRQKTLMPAMIEICDRPVMFELTQTAELAHWKGDANDPAWLAFVADLRNVAGGLPEPGPAAAAGAVLPPVAAANRSGRGLWVTLAVIAVAFVAGGTWFWQRSAGAHRARTQLIPEVSRLVDAGDNVSALKLAQQARRHAPDDPLLKSLTPLFAARYSITTKPEGVEVSVRPYAGTDAEWQHLGRTPLPQLELPRTTLRWRFEKPGFAKVERANSANVMELGSGRPAVVIDVNVELKPDAEQPEDMVLVPGGVAVPAGDAWPAANVPWFHMQRTEVTNAQYKEFVDAGGYERRTFWSELDEQLGGKPGGIEAAISQFVDSTDRPGPATWELGSYPEGQGDYPVTGVSWYEAAAYARYRGRQLRRVEPRQIHEERVSGPRCSAGARTSSARRRHPASRRCRPARGS